MTVSILVGDIFERLAELPSDHYGCALSSPPYWGLRSYLDATHPDKAMEIGCEPTLGEHLDVMVRFCREVRRVLRPDGVFWLNYGDCYATSPNGRSAADTKAAGNDDRTFRDKPFSTVQGAMKPKDMCLIPQRLAIALQEPYHLGPIKNEVDRAWLAGLVDGDGCIGIRCENNGKWNPSFIPYLTIGNSDVALIERCVQITGLGKLNLKSRAGDTDARGISQRRDGYVWRLDGQIASRVIRDIYPYLIQKKPQAAVCNAMNVSQEGGRPTRSAPVPADLIAYRQRLYEAIKDLNQRREVLLPDLPAVASNVEQGFWVRSLLPWVKRNGMPESISDRPASSVEYVIMLTKSARYAYDAESVRRAASLSTNARVAQNVAAQAGSERANGGAKTNGPMKAVVRGQTKQDATAAAAAAAGGSSGRRMAGFNDRWDEQGGKRRPGVTPKSAAEDTNIKAKGSFHASTSEVLNDRNFRNTDLFFDSLEPPFGLIHSAEGIPIAIDICPQGFKEAHFATFPEAFASQLLRAGNPNKLPVLDPFGGAGTVGLVAERLGMDSTLIELNPESVEIADRRIRSGLGRVAGIAPPKANDLPLFSGDAA